MEEIKEILKSPRKTVILGLVGSILWLVYYVFQTRGFVVLNPFILLSNITSIGLIVYFSIVLMRMNKKRVDIKIANYTLIITYIISALWNLRYFEIFTIIFLVINILYFCNIFLKKPQIIDNKIFLIANIVFRLLNLIFSFSLLSLVLTIILLSSVPYFYNYYELLKGGK